MELKKKIYKNMSIISLAIVVILIANLIIPIITHAEEGQENVNESIIMSFDEPDETNGTIRITGTIPDNYSEYELYWANKIYDREKPTDPAQNQTYFTETVEWFEKSENKVDGKDVTTVEGSTTIDSKAPFVRGNSYSVLCVAYGPNNVIMMSIATYKSNPAQEQTAEEITLELSQNDKVISIHASDESAEITSIKIEKSDVALTTDYFSEHGTSVTFDSSNNVTTSTTVGDYGVYYVYAENAQGYKVVKGIVLTNTNQPVEDDVTIELFRITDENYGDFAIRATSKVGNITAIKYYISENQLDVNNEETRNTIKNSGTAMNVSGDSKKEEITKTDSQVDDDKYIGVYVETNDGNYTYGNWKALGRIGNLNKVEIAPWENGQQPDNPTTDDPKTEDPKTEDPKTDDPKTEDPKTEDPKTEEPKTDDPKTEDPKTDEPKTDDPKTEDPKTEDPKTEDPKTEEPKTEDPKTEDPKTENPKTEDPKTEDPKTEDPKTEDPKTENPKTDTPKTDTPKTDTPKTDTPKTNNTQTITTPKSNGTQNSANTTEKSESNNINTYVSGDSKKNEIPQTGSNDNLLIAGIIVFSIIGLTGFIKYKKEQ